MSIDWGWTTYNPLTSTLCPVVVFCHGLHPLLREASLRRGESYTYPTLTCEYKDKYLNAVRNYGCLIKKNVICMVSSIYEPSSLR